MARPGQQTHTCSPDAMRLMLQFTQSRDRGTFFFSALGWHSMVHTSDGELLSYSYTSWDATVRLSANDPGDVRAQSTSNAHKVAAFQIIIKKKRRT